MISRLHRGFRARARLTVATAFLTSLVSACGSGGGKSGSQPFVAVLSAFPAELASVVQRATIDETVEADGRIFRLGTLGGARVVLAMTGIGLVNAEATTQALLDRFDVQGVVVSAVAGSYLRIADVAVPERWTLADGGEYAADAEWLALAEDVAASDVGFERCTVPPSGITEELVCLPHEPAIFVGGLGRSSDPFGGSAFECQPNGEVYPDVFGCDIVSEGGGTSDQIGLAPHDAEESTSEPLAAEDMETAVIAREAAARSLPFIAFRAASDGEGDPLDLPGFPAQFFAYYRLAANNAAAAATAFLEQLTKR